MISNKQHGHGPTTRMVVAGSATTTVALTYERGSMISRTCL